MSSESQGKSQVVLSLTIALLGFLGTLGTAIFNNWDKVFAEPKILAAPDELYQVTEDRDNFDIDGVSNTSNPGEAHPDYPNVIASETGEGWTPLAGYTWTYPDDANNLEVVWSPGKSHPDDPQVLASADEGNWTPAPGYDWVYPDDPNNLEVSWTPGATNPNYANIVASEIEGEWEPIDGYEWTHPDDVGDLQVSPINQ